jgi:molybdate transport system ATP-binding protein
VLRVAVLRKRPEFTLEARFAAPTPGITALFGPSGSGKTTLVNVISGLIAPDAGEVCLDDEVLTDSRAGIAVPVERRRIGYVFQDARLFPHLTVSGNLRYGEKRARAAQPLIGFDEVVSLLGLSPLLDRQPRQLSGGERQRVSLGRALLSQPRLLLLDEPLASIDAARREEVLPYLEALRDRLAIPMVYVSHQFDEVLRLATHLVLLGGGRVLAQGSVSELSLRPELQSIVGPDLVGAVLEGVVTRVDPEHGGADLSVGRGTVQVSVRGAPVGSRVRLQILARDVILAAQPVQGLSVRNAIASTVTAISNDDYGQVLVRLDVGGATVLARITHQALSALKLRPGDAVWALVKAVSTRGHAFRITPPGASHRI